MAKQRSPVADYLAYLVVRLAVCLIQTLTDRAAAGLVELLGQLAYCFDRRHRLVADDNLCHAFPDLGPSQRDRLVRGSFCHFATLIIEIARLPRKLNSANWFRHVDLLGGRQVATAITSGRAVMIVTGHFGNWEMAGYSLGLLGFNTHAVARPLDNPYLDRFLKKFRQRTGQKLLSKKGDVDQMLEVLSGGGVLATLADQDAGPRGVFVDFFGRPASTHKGIAILAIQQNALILVAGVPKIAEPRCYQIAIEDSIDPAEYAGRPDVAKVITQRYTAALERMIRRHPEQYFWLHRRWKHQPQQRAQRKAA
jgi:Kdo2-lipid IVA lauroyltransferase/acyltransferase